MSDIPERTPQPPDPWAGTYTETIDGAESQITIENVELTTAVYNTTVLQSLSLAYVKGLTTDQAESLLKTAQASDTLVQTTDEVMRTLSRDEPDLYDAAVELYNDRATLTAGPAVIPTSLRRAVLFALANTQDIESPPQNPTNAVYSYLLPLVQSILQERALQVLYSELTEDEVYCANQGHTSLAHQVRLYLTKFGQTVPLPNEVPRFAHDFAAKVRRSQAGDAATQASNAIAAEQYR